MTIRETLAEMLLLHRESLSELRAIRAVLEGPEQQDTRPDLESAVASALCATDMIRAGLLRRHR